ncbi:MAG: hypothetical protein O8C66_09445 [Candidatus Methanoperedens sp.]|nr:hypothetical protein [Candidatus Methanoperedens sp.]MCZ7370719.1 hypothetical protein [Candidatus Methanoperedens sp.]
MSGRRNLNKNDIIALSAIILISLIALVSYAIINQSKELPPTSAAKNTTTGSLLESSTPDQLNPINKLQTQQNICAEAGETPLVTQHNDNNRSGANLNEVILNTSNVNPAQFGKLYTLQVDGQIYAQPLYLCNVNIPNQGIHNVIYIATMHNTVYAFDADDPNATLPLWMASLGPSIPLPDPNIGPQEGYVDITGEVGIVSTPYISPENNTIYVVSSNKDPNSSDAGSYSHWLHALDISTGAEKLGGPVKISAIYPGNGDGSMDGILNFTSHRQLQRSALLLSNGMIYIAFSSYDDVTPSHGWVMSYSANTLNQTAVYVTTPDDVPIGPQLPGLGSIWQGGQGPAADSSGNIYFITGNGDFNGFSNPMPSDLGDSIVKLTPELKLVDWFSPHNNTELNENDLDFGSGGALLIPGTDLLVGGGKEAKLFLIDRNNMGHFNPNNDSQIVQPPFSVITKSDPQDNHELFGGPVYWDSPNGSLVYVSPSAAHVKAYRFAAGVFQPTTPVSESNITSVSGGWMSISANGSIPGTGILWVSELNVLHAFDASNLQNELWNSEMNPRDDIGEAAKFCPPTIANGKVYMASFSGGVAVYGLLS